MTEQALAHWLRPCYAIAAVCAGVGALSAAIELDLAWFLLFVGLIVLAALGYEWAIDE